MSPKPRSGHDEFDSAIPAALVGGLVAACVLAWATGQLAGLLFAHTWPRLDLAEVPLVVYGWTRHWRDPALAWPAGVRELLPGPVGMYFSLVLVVAAPLTLVCAVRRSRPGLRRSSWRSRGWARASGWASRWQVRRLAVRHAIGWGPDTRAAVSHWWTARTEAIASPAATALVLPALVAVLTLRLAGHGGRALGVVKSQPRGRVVLGRRSNGLCRPLLAAEECASVLAFGPPGSFKTAGLAIPAVLEWHGPLVATSMKPDVIRATLHHRALRGQTWIFNPLQAGGLPSNTWTPLASCRTWAGAREMGGWLASAADLTGQTRDDKHYWTMLGGKLLAVLLYAAAGTGRTIADVVRWVDVQEQHEVDDALAQLGDPSASDAWDACKAREERTRSSVYGTAETLLDAYADPRVAETAETCEIDLDLLLSGDHSLYLYAPAHQQRRLRPLFTALLSAVARRAQELAAERPDGMLKPRLLLCLDEAGNIAAIPDLPELATTGRGQGIQLVSIFHDLGQVEHRYGKRAMTVLNGHRAKLFLSGQADTGSLKLAAELIGDQTVTETSVSVGDDRTSWTHAERHRPLVPPARLRQLRPRQAVLVYGHLPPVKVRLRAWWRTPGLRRRAGGGR
ncbi:MAG: type IV secretory system conjugative DNA transfer family protein [Egibacteraceae bacterium]